MAKTNRTSPHKQQFEDEYEDFGYDVKNARRYQSNKKRTPKFKDYNEYEDTNWSVTVNEHSDQNHVMYMSRQELLHYVGWNSRHAWWDLRHRRFQGWCQDALWDCLRAWCQTPRNPRRLINMTESDLFALKENYVNMIVEGMDIDTLAQFAFDSIIANYEDVDAEDLKHEIVHDYDQEMLDSLMPTDMIQVNYSQEAMPSSWVSGTQGVVDAPNCCIV